MTSPALPLCTASVADAEKQLVLDIARWTNLIRCVCLQFQRLRDVLIRIKQNSCAQCERFHVFFFARDDLFLYWSSFDCTYWLPIFLCDLFLFYQAWHSVHAVTFSSIGAGLIA